MDSHKPDYVKNTVTEVKDLIGGVSYGATEDYHVYESKAIISEMIQLWPKSQLETIASLEEIKSSLLDRTSTYTW